MSKEKRFKIQSKTSKSNWMGITYKEDLPYLKDKIKQYTKQIDTQADNTQRLEILKKINEIQKKLKNKNLEDQKFERKIRTRTCKVN